MLLEIDYLKNIETLKTKTELNKKYIWDGIRKKWYVLLPEEMVRQLIIQHLILDLNFNKNFIKVEKQLKVNQLEKRCDILLYNKEFEPFLLIECKRPKIEINQKVFDQIAIYNIELRVPYLMVSNGIQTYCSKIDFDSKSYHFIDSIPNFSL